MKVKFDLTNKRFGRLFVTGRADVENRQPYWSCWCDCGKDVAVRSDALRAGITQSCGCLGIERRAAATSLKSVTHGLTRGKRGQQRQPAEYRAWSNMRQRCNNPNNHKFKDYGARGISVCVRWESFENFLADMGNHPGKGYSLDRIDVNGNYEPSNCRWADAKTQANNKRKKVIA